jgi:hypothetical protein
MPLFSSCTLLPNVRLAFNYLLYLAVRQSGSLTQINMASESRIPVKTAVLRSTCITNSYSQQYSNVRSQQASVTGFPMSCYMNSKISPPPSYHVKAQSPLIKGTWFPRGNACPKRLYQFFFAAGCAWPIEALSHGAARKFRMVVREKNGRYRIITMDFLILNFKNGCELLFLSTRQPMLHSILAEHVFTPLQVQIAKIEPCVCIS